MGVVTSKLFVISGPSGVGKGTLVARARARIPGLGLTVSATTRPMRPGEVDGREYYFLSDEEFSRRVDAGEFVEWAQVFDHRYGTLASEVDRNLGEGRSVILEIDVQGALQVRERYPDAVLIFIMPPSREELRARLTGRGTESEESLELRLATAEREIALADRYDEVLVNDDLDTAADELVRLLETYERN